MNMLPDARVHVFSSFVTTFCPEMYLIRIFWSIHGREVHARLHESRYSPKDLYHYLDHLLLFNIFTISLLAALHIKTQKTCKHYICVVFVLYICDIAILGSYHHHCEEIQVSFTMNHFTLSHSELLCLQFNHWILQKFWKICGALKREQ